MLHRRDGWGIVVSLTFAALLSGCIDTLPPDDLGDNWITGPSAEAVDWLAWSPDSATLYWIAGPNQPSLYAATMGSRSAILMATGVSSFPRPTLTADGSALFYTTYDPTGDSSALFEATIAGGGTSLADTRSIADNLFSYLVAADGTRVTLVDHTTGEVTIRDLASGHSVDIGQYPDPTAFSPDGRTLLARNAAANDEATHYLLVDTASGASTNLSFPMDQSIDGVTSWENERPRVVISGVGVLDLTTSASVRLTGIGQVDALASTPAHAFAYGWGDIDCLGPYTNAETGDHACSNFYFRMSRDDINSGARQVIASEVVYVENNADDFAPSPDGNWLAVAAGSGLIVDEASAVPSAIKLKRLTSP